MSRLILVSNRLPITLEAGESGVRVDPSPGGLAAALRDVHDRSRGLWIGWPGSTATLKAAQRAEVDALLANNGLVPIHLSSREVSRFYDDYSNGVLWPILHYLTGVLPLRIEGWSEYHAVNRRFANMVVANHTPGDTIWVHDYQLMLVPGMVRRQLPAARIGFFLHTPFPSSEIFAAIPEREDLLRGLLGADVIGFHTQEYIRHFQSAVKRVLGLRCDEGVSVEGGKWPELVANPVGTDVSAFSKAGRRPEVESAAVALKTEHAGRILLGIDRLDYTKGIPRRLLAFEELLTRRPEWKERVRLIQVAVPTRERVGAYRRFREEVEAIQARINREFGTASWMPIEYMHRSISETELLALYRAADVMLVTPVRDGMNLVAKEFVATRTDEDGVLVLSEFAGAAAELSEAVLVNPYDICGSAESYHRALTMAPAERQLRMRGMREKISRQPIQLWAESFLHHLGFMAAASRVIREPVAPQRTARRQLKVRP